LFDILQYHTFCLDLTQASSCCFDFIVDTNISKMKLLISAFIAALAAPSSAFVTPGLGRLQKVESATLGAMKGDGEIQSPGESFAKLALASLVSFSLLSNPLPAMADGQTQKFKLPPIDMLDKNRCSLNSSNLGQANAARDKLYDLRQCKLSGASAPGFDLSGVLMTDTDVSKANFKEAYFSKAYLHGKWIFDCSIDLMSPANSLLTDYIRLKF
jgi:uncharacterized protein YjbI with pentapeptide repeats